MDTTNPILQKRFAKNLERIMEKREKKQIDMVNDLNLPSSTVSNWRTGKKMPRINQVERIMRYLECDITNLFGKCEENKRRGGQAMTEKEMFDEIDKTIKYVCKEIREVGNDNAKMVSALAELLKARAEM